MNFESNIFKLFFKTVKRNSVHDIQCMERIKADSPRSAPARLERRPFSTQNDIFSPSLIRK